MNITLSTGELKELAQRLGKWSEDRAMVVVTLAFSGDLVRIGRQEFQLTMENWEKENPKPDWRTLL